MKKELQSLFDQQSVSELNHFLVDHSLVEKVLKQIKKDFNQCGIEIEIDRPTNDMVSVIRDVLKKLMDKSSEQLMNLLYRIDVNQTKLNYFINKEKNTPYEDIVTIAVIQREAQKVIIRDKLSNKNT